MEDFISIGTNITLNTGMSQKDFAKANMFSHITEKGYIATQDQNGAFSFSKWNFTDTAEKDGIMLALGDGFSGRLLYDVIMSCDESYRACANDAQKDAYKCVYTVLCAINCAIQENIQLPFCSPMGIIIRDDGALLFLPEIMLNRAASMRSKKIAAEYFDSWQQATLSSNAGLAFSVACMLYKVLTGKKAFSGESADAITEDFFDNNFVPIEYFVKIKPTLAELINKTLTGKIKYRPPIKKLCKEMPCNIDDCFVNDECTDEKSMQENAKNMQTNANAYIFKQHKKISRIRFFRKHITSISISAVCILVIGALAISMINNVATKPNTKGLSPLQTLESFYSALNHLQADELDACTTKEAGDSYSSFVTTMFVVGKVQTAYGSSTGYLTPCEWLASKTAKDDIIFGITNFTINGASANSSMMWFNSVNKDEPQGKTGDTETLDVAFYLLSSEGDDVQVQKHNDTLTLHYLEDRWVITSITEEKIVSTFNKQTFLQDFETKTRDEIKSLYDWFPTAKELEQGKIDLNARYTF